MEASSVRRFFSASFFPFICISGSHSFSRCMHQSHFNAKFITGTVTAYRNFSASAKSFGRRTTSLEHLSQPKDPGVRIKWNDQQEQILSAISRGKSVFITGSAGTGKTLLVKQIIEILKRHHPSGVFATASTGIAACAIGGQTLHSFAGIGLTKDRHALLNRVLVDKRARSRWKKVAALVIDEISMVDAELFDSLEYIARVIRKKDVVWGGIQLVVSGDFFQLPPVADFRNSLGKQFAFEADCWESSFDMQFELSQIFRQSDPQLVELLQSIRRGKCNTEFLEILQHSCSVAGSDQLDSSVIQLYPLKEDVTRVNEMRLKSLSERVTKYSAVDRGQNPWKNQLKKGMAPDELLICKGARVILIKNLDVSSGLVNGATGTVTGFHESKSKGVRDICCESVLPIVRFDSGLSMVIEPETWAVEEGDRVLARREQVPLLLAWALSIHKCQGMTMEKLHTDLSRAFGCGMVYVALSRVKSLEGLRLTGFTPSKIRAHPKVLQFYKSFENNSAKRTGGRGGGRGSHEAEAQVAVEAEMEAAMEVEVKAQR